LRKRAARRRAHLTSGTADQLTQTWNAIQINLLLALVIVFLVMAVLFESFILPLVIMISVPVAGGGGVAGLALLNLYQPQPLDMLTLLGFVILIGIVVNNAILIVHQSLYHLREEGMAPDDAILAATRNRIRPIFMSTLTSVFGMLPLVVFPGAGSELYRGLGSVVVGGLALSALLTLLLVPRCCGYRCRPPPQKSGDTGAAVPAVSRVSRSTTARELRSSTAARSWSSQICSASVAQSPPSPQPFSLATAWSPPVRPRRNPGLAAHTETTPSTTRPR
jgi:uncharacterized membrane protein YdfJ with MMPL/SSD domain